KKQYSAIVDIWIKSISEAAVTTFYPNPTTGLVQVELSEAFDRTLPVQLRLYNSTGQLVQEQQLSASENLDLSAVMAGVYHIEIIQNSTRATARILRIE
ncbi:MAG: T9SS type A sorting domain-containing protein, partial [Bacteroidota bacterium]